MAENQRRQCLHESLKVKTRSAGFAQSAKTGKRVKRMMDQMAGPTSKGKAKIIRRTFACRRNNLTIRGTEYRQEGGCRPAAIVSHGFMAFQDTVRPYAKAMAEMGYVSYCFDFCGGCVINGKSDGSTTEMSVLTEVQDLEAVIHYVQSREYVNPDEIVLMGCSQGGFVSAIAAARLHDQISKLVLFYPALCIPDDARAGKMMFAKFDPDNIPDLIRCGPMKLGKCYVKDVIGLDPYQEIQDFSGGCFDCAWYEGQHCGH